MSALRRTVKRVDADCLDIVRVAVHAHDCVLGHGGDTKAGGKFQ
jgi:hypothetical protein